MTTGTGPIISTYVNAFHGVQLSADGQRLAVMLTTEGTSSIAKKVYVYDWVLDTNGMSKWKWVFSKSLSMQGPDEPVVSLKPYLMDMSADGKMIALLSTNHRE